MSAKTFFSKLLAVLVAASLLIPAPARVEAAPLEDPVLGTTAMVLVNSSSGRFTDFDRFIKPYLDHFGIPYTIVDIFVDDNIIADINAYSLIVIGHSEIDIEDDYLDESEEQYILDAVAAGAGLVNFDNTLSWVTEAEQRVPLYDFVNTIFHFGYTADVTTSGVSFSDDEMHYITQLHEPGETITTGNMTLAGITLPENVTSLVNSENHPFLTAVTYESGRAVQWGSYDWMSHAVKGPVYGLDDLVWRSIVWAARKPFVMQGMPPFVTMRMDDTIGPLDWIHIANEYGFKPWAGIFINNINDDEAIDLKELVDTGKATTALHAFSPTEFFYFDHGNGINFPDNQIADYFDTADQWFNSRQIQTSKYLVGHYYELGSNVFEELYDRGFRYVGTMMNPGRPEAGSSWIMNGPFRSYEEGTTTDQYPLYYADYLKIPGHNELDEKFFNCVTEIRDVTGYEWNPNQDVQNSIDQGTQWLKRALDGMDLATLFSHEYMLPNNGVSMAQWRQMMEGITQNIAAYNPLYVTMDEACQYVRAIRESNIISSTLNPTTNQVTTNFSGTTDITTKFYVFTEITGAIQQSLVDVPAFSGTEQVDFIVPGPLDHITISPNPTDVVAGGAVQFTAQGFDPNDNLIQNLKFNWSLSNGAGSITQNGLFTAGLNLGNYPDLVIASVGGVQGKASVNVVDTTLHHFSFDPINSPQYAGTPFRVTIRARDENDNPVVSYHGQVSLSVDSGTISPTQSGDFVNGVWSGYLTHNQEATVVILTASSDDYSGVSNSFDVVSLRKCPCSIWNNNVSVPNPNVNDDDLPIELGVRFRSDIDGYITGLRFYKGNLNTGTHLGHLWTQEGQRLAELTFTNETAYGWQQAYFSEPVSITAYTTYVASYLSPTGYFAESDYYFDDATFNRPLKALAAGEDGYNGIYIKNDPDGGFPTQIWSGHAPNYWVDVVFMSGFGPDTSPPTIVSVSPQNEDTGINVISNISASFDEMMDPATIDSASFELRDSDDNLVPAVVTYSSPEMTAILNPVASLAYSTQYTATLQAGQNGMKDLAGNPLATEYSWSFTTSAQPPIPSDDGPGGPILVISTADNPFSRYYKEILLAEGLNEFRAMDITKLTDETVLNGYRVIILGEMPLNAVQVTMLTNWVNAGGILIAMRPDPLLADLLGLSITNDTLSDAYLRVGNSTGPGKGIVGETIQFHGLADIYTLNGASSIATIYQGADTATTNPAVTIRSVGINGGLAAAFAYDLARSVIYTRQGNPAWAGQERDGTSPIRSDDLFYGNAAHDPQPDWINLDKVGIPQADEQQRLLANIILLGQMPLPRFWYFPRGEKAVVIMTGDDHGSGSTAGRFDLYIADSPAGCSPANWDCIRATSYVDKNVNMTNEEAVYYSDRGFEVALHVDTGCVDFTPESLEQTYAEQLGVWQAKFPNLPTPQTERTHCVVWSDWNTQPLIQLPLGIRLDLNYYFWPPQWVHNEPGFFTGSGIPMRFADQDGNTINVYQAATQMTDETGQSFPYTINTLLTKALGPEGYYGIFTANMHHDGVQSLEAEAIIDNAIDKGVPVVSAKQVLEWLDGRNDSSFKNLSWNGGNLNFRVETGEGANGLQVLLPFQSTAGLMTSLTLSGDPVSYSTEDIKGVKYSVFMARIGTYQAIYETDSTPPTITNVTSTTNTDGSVTISWVTDETATSRVVYGTNQDQLTLNSEDDVLVDSHSITLQNLLPQTKYYYRVISQDGIGNSATWPDSENAPASFTTTGYILIDTTVENFEEGMLDEDTFVTQSGNGEVQLKPIIGENFSGFDLPTGWTSSPWTGGTAQLSGGELIVDGTLAHTDEYLTPGRAMEFTATFGNETFQHAGFGQSLVLFSESWAMFSTSVSTDHLYARINKNNVTTDVLIPGDWVGTTHLYRIEWNRTNVLFYIDGNLVYSQNISIDENLRPIFSDYDKGGPSLRINWVQVTPYSDSGVFTSRVFDATSTVSWETIAWNATVPTGTSLDLSYRTGDLPDLSGKVWTPISGVSPADLNRTGRYIQYRAILATTDPHKTPILEDVILNYHTGPDIAPPTILARSPAPDATGVSASTSVTVTFSEAMAASTINTATFSLRADGAGSDIPAGVTYNPVTFTATLTPTSILDPGNVFHVNLSGGITDQAANPLTATSWSFTTATLPGAFARLSPVNGALKVPLQTTLSWQPSAGATSYQYCVSTDQTCSWIDTNDTNISLSGLSLGSTYFWKVQAVNSIGVTPADGGWWQFTTVIEGNLSDTSVVQFGRGQSWACIIDPAVGDGALRLPASVAGDFSGSMLPANWEITGWGGPPNYTFTGSSIGLKDSLLVYGIPNYGPGRSIEFKATFLPNSKGHIGLGTDLNAIPFAIFSTGNFGTQLLARSNGLSTPLPGVTLGQPHVFHIDWWENQIDYYVDGVWVATHTISITGNMRPVASMINGSSQEPLLIDWMRMTPPGAPPYAPSCSFISGIFNAGFEARWTNLAWTGTNPSGTTISFLTRSGNTEFPGDGTWSGWEPVVDGNISCPNAAYIQYRVVVSTTDPNLTPIIENVTLTFTLAEPTVALLASFTAEADLHNVLLEWETASELALVGFNLYRSDSDVGVKTKVNFELIPASYPGQSLGDSYQFTDNGEQGKNYFYWLEMVKTNGTSLTEPISVTIDYGIYLPMIVK